MVLLHNMSPAARGGPRYYTGYREGSSVVMRQYWDINAADLDLLGRATLLSGGGGLMLRSEAEDSGALMLYPRQPGDFNVVMSDDAHAHGSIVFGSADKSPLFPDARRLVLANPAWMDGQARPGAEANRAEKREAARRRFEQFGAAWEAIKPGQRLGDEEPTSVVIAAQCGTCTKKMATLRCASCRAAFFCDAAACAEAHHCPSANAVMALDTRTQMWCCRCVARARSSTASCLTTRATATGRSTICVASAPSWRRRWSCCWRRSLCFSICCCAPSAATTWHTCRWVVPCCWPYLLPVAPASPLSSWATLRCPLATHGCGTTATLCPVPLLWHCPSPDAARVCAAGAPLLSPLRSAERSRPPRRRRQTAARCKQPRFRLARVPGRVVVGQPHGAAVALPGVPHRADGTRVAGESASDTASLSMDCADAALDNGVYFRVVEALNKRVSFFRGAPSRKGEKEHPV
ncbi:hypothetical protein U1Q18_051978 [Sarracenia purpurea var. burkii]